MRRLLEVSPGEEQAAAPTPPCIAEKTDWMYQHPADITAGAQQLSGRWQHHITRRLYRMKLFCRRLPCSTAQKQHRRGHLHKHHCHLQDGLAGLPPDQAAGQ